MFSSYWYYQNVFCYWLNWGGSVSRQIILLFLMQNRPVPLWLDYAWLTVLLSTVILSVKLGQLTLGMNYVPMLSCIFTSRTHALVGARVWRTRRVAGNHSSLKSYWLQEEECCFWADSSRRVVGELLWLHFFCLVGCFLINVSELENEYGNASIAPILRVIGFSGIVWRGSFTVGSWKSEIPSPKGECTGDGYLPYVSLKIC